MYTLIVTLGIVATLLFLAGFAYGLRNAIREYRRGTPESNVVPDYNYGSLAAVSVAASAILIAAAGFSSAFVYAGPLLAIVTAAGVGIAFFVEKAEA